MNNEFLSNREMLEKAIKAIDVGDYKKAANLAHSASIRLTKKALGGIGSSDFWSEENNSQK